MCQCLVHLSLTLSYILHLKTSFVTSIHFCIQAQSVLLSRGQQIPAAPPSISSFPLLSRVRKETTTQQHCFDFLQQYSLMLRSRYLTPQMEAKAELVGRLVLHGVSLWHPFTLMGYYRVDLIARRKERQMAELVELEEQSRELQEAAQTLAVRLNQSKQVGSALTERWVHSSADNSHPLRISHPSSVERILCSISTSSPVLSDAEEGMAREMRSSQQQLKNLQLLIEKVQYWKGVGWCCQSHLWCRHELRLRSA